MRMQQSGAGGSLACSNKTDETSPLLPTPQQHNGRMIVGEDTNNNNNSASTTATTGGDEDNEISIYPMKKESSNEQPPVEICAMRRQKIVDERVPAAGPSADVEIEGDTTNSRNGTFRIPRRETTILVGDERVPVIEARNRTETTDWSSSLTMAVLVAVLTQLLVGYNIGVMNALEPVVFPGHGTAAWSLAVASFAAGAPFGARYAGGKADERGRKSTILATARLFLVGGLLQTLAPRLWVVALARFLIGFASGCSSLLIPIYLGELAPSTLRGTLGSVTQLATVTGILVANVLSFPLAREAPLWRLLFAVNVVVACIILGISPFLLESPRWLLQRDECSSEARSVLAALRNIKDDRQLEREILRQLSAVKAQGPGFASSLTDIWNETNTRSLLIGALVVHTAQQFSGINAVFLEPLVGTTIVGMVNVMATYGSLLVMESTDRRTLLLASSGGMMICAVVLILSLGGYFNNVVALGAVVFYVMLFELGLGPIPWLIVPELFSSKHVAAAMAAATQVNWVASFFVSLIFPFLQKELGAYSFAPFVICLVLTFIYTWLLLPETRGKTPEEVYQVLATSISR